MEDRRPSHHPMQETCAPRLTASDAHMAVRRAAQMQPVGTDARKPAPESPPSRLNQRET